MTKFDQAIRDLKNNSVTTLNLDSLQINDAGAASIAAALKSNTSLTELWLSANQIGDAEIKAIDDQLNRIKSMPQEEKNKIRAKNAQKLAAEKAEETLRQKEQEDKEQEDKERADRNYKQAEEAKRELHDKEKQANFISKILSPVQKMYLDAAALYKQGNYNEASTKYEATIKKLLKHIKEHEEKTDDEFSESLNTMLINSYIGWAQASIEDKEYENTIKACELAIEIKNNSKEAKELKAQALIKLAEGNEENDNYNDSINYYNQALKIKVGDKAIKAKRDNVKAKDEIQESMKEITKSFKEKEITLNKKQQNEMQKLQKTVKDMLSNSNVVSEQLKEFVNRLKGMEIDGEQFTSTLSGLTEEIEKMQHESHSGNNDVGVHMLDEVIYDKELLNHRHLLKDAITLFGFDKAINLSDGLDPHLISEAVMLSDGDIILAGLVSLDLSEL